LLNNVLFWCSMILGLSLVSTNVPIFCDAGRAHVRIFADDLLTDVCALRACLDTLVRRDRTLEYHSALWVC
jgi:hypothetical protein